MSNKICIIGNANSIHVIRYVNKIKKLGYSCFVLSPETSNEIEVDLLLINYYSRNILKKLFITIKILEFINRNNISIVHYQFFSFPSIESLFIKKKQYATIWGGDVFYGERFNGNYIFRKIKKNVLRLLFKKMDCVLTHSKYVGYYLQKEYKLNQLTIKLFPFVSGDINKNKSLSRLLPENWTKKKIILSPRAIKPIYNIKSIVRCMEFLPKEYVLIQKNYSNRDSYTNEVEKIINKYDMTSRILILENLTEDDNDLLYQLSDIVVSIAESDMMSISVIESIRNMKPVIIYKTLSYEMEFSNINGIELIEDLSPRVLSETIMNTIGLDIDEKNYNSIAYFYSEKNMEKSIMELYKF